MARDWRQSSALALLVLLGTTGCVDSGLPGKNLPLEQARHRAWSYPLYEVAAQQSEVPALISLDDRTWALSAIVPPELGTESTLARDPSLLRTVSSAGGASLQALTWDDSPFDLLFARTSAGIRTYQRVY